MEGNYLYRFLLGLIVLIFISLLGYFVFLGFINKNQLILSLFPLALVSGLASFFSPCVFPLLPAAVTTNLKSAGKAEPFFIGFSASAGVLSFLLLLGVIIGFIGQPLGVFLQANLPLIRGIIGIFLIYLAYTQFSDKFHFGFLEKLTPKLTEREGGFKNAYLYGFGYTLAGSGCTVPILGGLILGSLASGGFWSGFTSFIIAGGVMAFLMFLFMGLVGYLKFLPENVTAQTPKIKKVSALVLFLVGAFYIGNAIFKFI